MGTSGGGNNQLVVVHKNQVPVLCKSTKYWVLPWKTRLPTPCIMEGIEKFLKTVAKSALQFPYIWRTKTKLNNQQKPNSSFKKQIFQKLFLKKAYIFCPDFFAYRVKDIFERRWCLPKQTHNWIAAKRRINRHDLYGVSAAERLTAQCRAGLPVRKVRFGSANNKYSLMSRFLRLTSRS